MRTAPITSGAVTGSPSTTNAIATAASGAAPTTTDVLDAPTRLIAAVKRSCEVPGASKPASAYGHAPETSCVPATSAAAAATANATATVERAATPASAWRA